MTLEELKILDSQLTLEINSANTVFFDGIIQNVTNTTFWIPVFIFVLYLIYHNNTTRDTFLVLGIFAITMLVSNTVCLALVKPWAERLRPLEDPSLCNYLHLIPGYHPEGFSFYSSHSSNAFIIAVFTSLLFRHTKFTLFICTWAAIVAYTRIYLGAHFLGDVLVGITAGSLFGSLGYLLLYYIQAKKHSKRKLISSNFTSSGYLRHELEICLTICYLNAFAIMLYSVIGLTKNLL